MIGTQDDLRNHVYRSLLWGFLALGTLTITPAANGQATPQFPAISDPPQTPPSSIYSLDPKSKPISFGYTSTRNERGVVSIASAGPTPKSLAILFDDGTGRPDSAPPTVTVQVGLTYQGKTVRFTAPANDVTLAKGIYTVDMTSVATSVVSAIGNRLPPGFDPSSPPAGVFTIADVKFFVTPDGGNAKVVDPGKVVPTITVDEAIGDQ